MDESIRITLRDEPIVSVHLDEDEVRILQTCLQGFDPRSQGFRMALQRVQNPLEVADRLLDRISGSAWVSMSNVELHVAMNSVSAEDLDLAMRMKDATRPLERMDPGAHPLSYRGAGWDEAKMRARRNAGNACEECGETEMLHVHHLIRYRRFNTPSDANTQGNLQVLCPTCHGAAE